MTTRMTLRVNGSDHDIAVAPDTLLLDALRYECGLTGAKLGCGTGDCGACTVTVDGEAVNSCLVYARECEGHSVETVEGVTASGIGAVVVEEFLKADAVQCGFCTPGIIMSTCALLARTEPGAATDEDVKEALAGNLCRCTGYLPILDAVRRASRAAR
ncbi:(2Fe-2S)-binding protein [Streptomyces sp. NPDC001027]|uniref:(2Fe-2S)-binding protein n=1 Tax=Streptomyces sp. NPDC001027 TaxID=3154771 RepID=UPI003334427C